ncbi:MAG: hypothetical protein LBJ39_02790 [Tannerellaceae bacterium]|jgi:hypothetical protein|nr:hypothetical protein [Tannerellaceae bacterium]
MKTRYESWVNRFMLVSGFILLLTVVVPHHHHEDGAPCIFLWENENAAGDDGEEHHSCECNGHTIAFNSTTLNKHASETHNDIALLLIPLYTLFDYINSSFPLPGDKVCDSDKTLHAETLFNVWAPVATGFRAPPLC